MDSFNRLRGKKIIRGRFFDLVRHEYHQCIRCDCGLYNTYNGDYIG